MPAANVTIDCLRAEHQVLALRYPLFVGFLAAHRLAAIAESPHFDLETTHVQIAGNVRSSPVREWQRPLDQARADEITRIFSTSSEIMPNAVLLAAPDPTRLTLTPQSGRLWSLSVPEPAEGEKKPLWILDGQHRIAGLASSEHEIPFVLLASHNQSAEYQESRFAKIFAQVTTTAEGLHPLHNEWLTFAFALGKYETASGGVKATQQQRAMSTVIDLCHTRYLDEDESLANPFFDKVAFNPGSVKRTTPPKPVGPSKGGFQYNAVDLQALINDSYFAAEITTRTLSPSEIARQVGLAYEALVECHDAAARPLSVLLNAPPTGHSALQNAYMHGILRFLATHGAPADWMEELIARAFRQTDWSKAAWSGERGGTEGNINRKLARSVFEALFEGGLDALFLDGAPDDDVDLGEYCSGDIGFGLELRGQRTRPNGRRLPFSSAEDPMTTVAAGTATSRLRIDELRAISIGRTTPNIVAVDVRETGRPFERHWSFAGLKSGLALGEAHLYREPVELRFEFTFYGGSQKDPKVKVQWSDADDDDA
jgi:hypothetical protein